MSLGRLENRLGAFMATAAAFTIALSAGQARADGPVTPTGKGIVGGALLGGEVVTITIGAVGVNRGWPYFVFGGLGMVGGGIGGYFVEKATAATPEPALYMLAGGMALVIPALVVSLNATAYRPPESDRNEPANNEPTRDAPRPAPPPGMAPPAGVAPPPGAPQSRAPAQYRFRGEMASLPHIPVSLLDVYRGKLAFGVPAVEVKPLYSAHEIWQYGVAQGAEVKLPVFKAMF